MAEQKGTMEETTNGKKPSRNGENDHVRSFDPTRYLIQLPKREKVNLPDGRVSWKSASVDYLPVAARIAWFRIEHPAWSIITKEVKAAQKATVMNIAHYALWREFFRQGFPKTSLTDLLLSSSDSPTTIPSGPRTKQSRYLSSYCATSSTKDAPMGRS